MSDALVLCLAYGKKSVCIRSYKQLYYNALLCLFQLIFVSSFRSFSTCIRLPRWCSGQESACPCRRCGFNPWLEKIPLEEEMAAHSSILAWKIPWREEPGGLPSMGSQRVRHDWATEPTHSLHHLSGTYVTSSAHRDPDTWFFLTIY